MPIAEILDHLNRLSTAPTETEAFDAWLGFDDAVTFVEENALEDEFVVYAGLPHTFMHAVTVPAAAATPPDVDDLLSWSCNASSSWGIAQSFSPARVWVSPPLDHTRSKTLDQGEQLVFARSFEGSPDKTSYFEILQKFTHIFGLHYLPERNAYCRLDRLGDLDDVVRIIRVPTSGDRFGGMVVTLRRHVLDQYLAVTDSVAIRMFAFKRYRRSDLRVWSQRHDSVRTTSGNLFYDTVVESGHAGNMRGCQVVRPLNPRDTLIRQVTDGDDEDEKYASFIAVDWKHDGALGEVSCAPDATDNYFTESNRPLEMSPAFFRPDVLAKYKADSAKYQFEDRSIRCRGAWHLKTYDINEAGQVHTYLAYLRDLPYEEQLYWKAYNEKPKGPISDRAYRTDFQNQWDGGYDALRSIKGRARELHQEQVPWWKLRDETLLERAHYPVTSSVDEWENELLHLDQLLVEGFEEKWLRKQAAALGRAPEVPWRSLKLIEECLLGSGFEADHARQLLLPFRELHDLRSKLKGHASGTEAAEIRKSARMKHGSYQKHFRNLCRECDESLGVIAGSLREIQ